MQSGLTNANLGHGAYMYIHTYIYVCTKCKCTIFVRMYIDQTLTLTRRFSHKSAILVVGESRKCANITDY